MAYAAVISLKHNLQGLQSSGNFSIPNSESGILDSTIEEIESLQQVLEILDESNMIGWMSVKVWDLFESQMLKHFPSEYPIVQFVFMDIPSLDEFLYSTRVDASDGQIIEAVSKLEEVLHQCWLLSSMELDRVKQEIYSFTQTVKMINEEEKLKKEDNQNESKDIVDLCDKFPKSTNLIDALKLRCYAFRGPKWEIQDNGFPELTFLLIEDTDLSNWIFGRGSIPKLRYMILKSCYKLEMIPQLASYGTRIELENCNPLGVACAQQLERFSMGGYHFAIISKSMLD